MLNNGCLMCGRELDSGSINGLCQSCYNKSINNNFSIEYHGDFSINPPINNEYIRYVDEDKVLALIRGVIAKEKDEHTLKVLKSLYYDLLRMEENSGSGVGGIGDVVTCPSHPDGTTGLNGFDITTIDSTRTQTVGSLDKITAEVGEDPIIALKDLEETITKLKKERDKWFRAYQEADAINSQLDSDNRKLKEELNDHKRL